MDFITCPWCGQRNPADALECRSCGGPLPVSGSDPGPEPPPPPRQLPKGYKNRVLWKNAPGNAIGLVFAVIGISLLCIFAPVGLISGLLPILCIGGGMGVIFALIGGGLLYTGVRNGLRKIRPYELGYAAIGEITEIYRDTSMEVNGRNPWAVRYQFEADGQLYEGKATTWKYAPNLHKSGDRVHVLYLTEDPEQNALYPPLG